MYNILFDMETNDIDDFLTLCYLASHKEVNLLGVTLNPGSPEQVGIVKWVIKKNKLNTRIGVPDTKFLNIKSLAKNNNIVSPLHYKIVGENEYSLLNKQSSTARSPVSRQVSLARSLEAEEVCFLINDILTKEPDTILLTGAPLVNISKTLNKYPNLIINKWYCQGGFAGTNIIDKKYELEKFKGKILCRTFNLNVSPNDSLNVVNSKQIKEKIFISKNVCHGLFYDNDLHYKLNIAKKDDIGLNIIFETMKHYIEKKHKNKLIHDLLACTNIFNDKICEFKEVELYYLNGMWGSKLSKTPNIKISVSLNKNEFEKTFLKL